MNLCIDIGNSFIKYAIFRKGDIVRDWRTKDLLVRDLKALRNKYPFTAVILSTTRKSLPRFTPYLQKNFDFTLLNHRTDLPFKNLYKTPKTLGKDRLAAVAGAQKVFPKTNCVIFDIGTCMTADIIDRNGHYFGGNISPGKDLRLRSMHDYTSALPRVKPKFNKEIIGKTTTSAMQNGGILGVLFEIEGFINRLERDFGRINVILTGGDAIRFGELLECKKFVMPKLVLIGLNAILENNEATNI